MTPPGDALQPHAVRTARRRCRELKPGGSRLRRIALTVVVPYLVSTFSSVGAIRELRGSKDVSAPEEQDARRYHTTSSETG